MGQGGHIVFVNSTIYEWKRLSQGNHQMNTWNFPEVVKPGQLYSIYIEFSYSKGDNAVVHYQIEEGEKSHNSVFVVQATKAPDFNIQVYFLDLASQNNPTGSTLNLGWRHDHSVRWILAGRLGHYISSNPSPDWLHQNLDLLGEKRLKDICFGMQSHDAGMSEYREHTAVGWPEDTLTQLKSIGEQLASGVRFFDIRPVISGGKYVTGHYSDIKVFGWQGANGQRLGQIIEQINAFTTRCAELVILDIGDGLNTDVGHPSYRPFNPVEWMGFLAQLSSLSHLFTPPPSMGNDLTSEKLRDFIGQDRAAVLCLIRPNIDLGRFKDKGFFSSQRFMSRGEYSNTDNLSDMIRDQKDKLRKNRTGNDSPFFNLFWTLTQSAGDAILRSPSVLQLAEQARDPLYEEIFPMISRSCYPNIFSMDGIDNGDATALAMAVNWKLSIRDVAAAEQAVEDNAESLLVRSTL